MQMHIKEVVRWQELYRENSHAENIVMIARLHMKFLIIHPFIDGNGRTSRALAYYLYLFAGLPPFIFTADDRHETYYRCFDEPIIDYFFGRTES